MIVNALFARTPTGEIYERSTWMDRTGRQVGLITLGFPDRGYEVLPSSVEVPDLLSALRSCYDACRRNRFYTGDNFSTQIIMPKDM